MEANDEEIKQKMDLLNTLNSELESKKLKL